MFTFHQVCIWRGGVILEDNVFIGTGAIVLPGVRICKEAVVGAGAVVIRDVATGATVAGVPAKLINNRIEKEGKK